MDKGLGPPPQPFTTCKWRVPPPNPSRLANGQGLGWGPLPNGQGLGANFQIKTRVGGPNPDLQMDKGWGPTLHDSTPPNPARLADGQGLGAPTLHDLRMDKGWGPPNPSRLANLKFCLDKHWGLQTIERLSIFHRGPGASPQIETSMTSPSSQNVR